MKRILMFVLLFAALKVAGQTTGYLRFDTVKIMKQNGTCELYVINSTKDSLGLLTNIGGGLTRFIKPKVFNDSTIIVGLDTLVLRGATGVSSLNNVGTGYNLVATPGGNIKKLNNGYGIIIDSTTTANTITIQADTSSTNHVVTQSDLNDAIAAAGTPPGTPDNAIQYRKSDGTFGGDSLQYYPTENKLLTSQDYIQYGRPVVGHFQDSAWNYTSGKLWMLYPRHSNGTPGQAVDPSWGADTLQPFVSDHGNALYDVGQPENAVVNLIRFGSTGNYRPMMRFAFEQNFYNTIEHHFTTKPRLMNPNDEIRHMSWTIDDITGNAHLDWRATQVQYSWSKVDDVDYNRAFLGIGNNGVLAQTWGANGTMSVTHGNSAAAKTIGMVVDTASGGTGVGAFYVSTNTPFLYLGSSAGSTGIDISNPATTGGLITMHKSTTTFGKALGISGLPNSSAVGLYVTTGAVGYVHNVSTDGNGYANVNTVGTMSINRDPLGFGLGDKMFSIYNNFNPNDSIYHIRGNGSIWTKGLMNIRTLKTTVTAPATEGTTKMVITDTNGLLSYADIPSGGGITSINSDTGPAFTIQGSTGIDIVNTTGTATIAFRTNDPWVPHVMDKQYSDANNTGTSESDLYSFTIPANTLALDGQSIHFETSGTLNDATASVAFQFYFGGTSFANTSAQTLSATGSWCATGYIMRTSSSTARAYAVITSDKMTDKSYVFTATLTGLDFTDANILKCTGQASGGGGGSNDITQKSWVVKYLPITL